MMRDHGRANSLRRKRVLSTNTGRTLEVGGPKAALPSITKHKKLCCCRYYGCFSGYTRDHAHIESENISHGRGRRVGSPHRHAVPVC